MLSKLSMTLSLVLSREISKEGVFFYESPSMLRSLSFFKNEWGFPSSRRQRRVKQARGHCESSCSHWMWDRWVSGLLLEPVSGQKLPRRPSPDGHKPGLLPNGAKVLSYFSYFINWRWNLIKGFNCSFPSIDSGFISLDLSHHKQNIKNQNISPALIRAIIFPCSLECGNTELFCTPFTLCWDCK